MSDISRISDRIDELAQSLDRIIVSQEGLCEGGLSAGVAAAPRPGLAELEAAKSEAEALKRKLAALRHKSKLDPEVLALENKLDAVLSRSYWLWQKCKDNMA